MRPLINILSTVAVFFVGAMVLLYGSTEDVEWTGDPGVHPEAHAFEPEFTTELREEFPQCHKGTHNLDPKLVVHADGEHEVLDFDAALAASKTGNTWVIASCD